jgi:hypothetical protein
LPFNNALLLFRHTDIAKIESMLEGVRKGHAIAMEELNTQLQKSLAENPSRRSIEGPAVPWLLEAKRGG